MEVRGFHVLDGGAEGKLLVVVGVEITADDPADDFLGGEFLFHFFGVGDDLFDRFRTDRGDVFRSFGSLISAIATEVDTIGQDQASAIRVLEDSNRETALQAGCVFCVLVIFLPSRVEVELGSDDALLKRGLFGFEIDETRGDVGFHPIQWFDEFFGRLLIADFLGEEDVGIGFFENFLSGFDVFGLIGFFGILRSTGEPTDVP